jgi:hypothetical protein
MSRIGSCNCCGTENIPLTVDGECAICDMQLAECEGEDIGQYDVGHEDDYQQEAPEKF